MDNNTIDKVIIKHQSEKGRPHLHTARYSKRGGAHAGRGYVPSQ